MKSANLVITVCAFVLAGFASPEASRSAACQVSMSEFQVGRDNDLLVCGTDVTPQSEVIGFKEAGIDLVYQQYLRVCEVGGKVPGLHLVVKPRAGATRGKLDITDGEAGLSLCKKPLGFSVADGGEPDPVPTWANAMPPEAAKTIDVDGIRTRYFDMGAGTPLVLVHGGQAGGSNNSAEKWEQNVLGLAEHFRVIALDRLAQGQTGNLPDPEQYVDYFARDAKHLEGFLDALDIKGAALVGHSQGGWPITRVALTRPDLVSCLVNVDSVMVPDDRALMMQALSFLIYTATSLHPKEGPTFYSARRGMALRYPSGNNITDQKAQRVVDQYSLEKTKHARAHMSAQGLTPQHASFVALKDKAFDEIKTGGLKAKHLIVWGEQDPQVPIELGQAMHDLFTEGNAETQFQTIAGAGHAPFIEFPEQFNQLVVDFCNVQ